ncbi:hypothetical protein MJO28_014488 [Puccinia striiformis f. sp. tritici]|nr:hypothetical protein MJO28_014488 [Puccinia striiformis f. sp. tritici]
MSSFAVDWLRLEVAEAALPHTYAALAMIALPSAQLAHSSRAAAKLLLPRDGTPVRPNPGSAANRPIHCTFEMTVSEPTTTCINDIRNEGTWQCPVDGCNNGGENLSPHDYPFSEFSFKRCKRAHGGGPKDAITVFPTRFSETRSEKLLLVFGHELPPHSYTPRKEEMKYLCYWTSPGDPNALRPCEFNPKTNQMSGAPGAHFLDERNRFKILIGYKKALNIVPFHLAPDLLPTSLFWIISVKNNTVVSSFYLACENFESHRMDPLVTS